MIRSRVEDIWNKMESTFQQSERNIVLYTGLVSKSAYDRACMKIYPMDESDLQKSNIETELLQEAIKEKKKVKLGSFFLKTDFLKVKKLANRVSAFGGTIITKNSPYHITVQVCQNDKYIKQLQKLAKIFSQNNISWRTPCAPYIYKIFDVYLLSSDLPWYEEIEDIIIDFEEYSQYIVKDYIPVWNLEKLSMMTDLRPEPIAGSSKYLHIVNGRRLEQGIRYLVADNQVELESHITKRGIEIICEEEEERAWQLYRVEDKVEETMEYEMFSNKIQNIGLNPARTVGAITRIVYGLGYEERFLLKSLESMDVCQTKDEIYSLGTESRESLLGYKYTLQLKLIFMSKKDDYLQKDILNYLVSELQRMYPEIKYIVELM